MRVKALHIITPLALLGCIEQFELPVSDGLSDRALVVDGSITDEEGRYTVRLTNTKPISADTVAQPETGATVTITEEDGVSVTLIEVRPGTYQTVAGEIRGKVGKRYQLAIRLFDGLAYQSSWELMLESPEIDEVTYDLSNDNMPGAQIYLNTTDKNGESSFFRWNMAETWKYEAPLVSDQIFVRTGLTIDKPEEDIHKICWKQSRVTDIMIASVSDLSESSLTNHPLLFVTSDSARFDIRYTALIKQSVIDLKEYTFWKGLRETNVNIGSIYDNQPYQVVGNMESLQGEQNSVFGYFSANAVTEKRIFIDRSEFSRETRPDLAFDDCVIYEHDRQCTPWQTAAECTEAHDEILRDLVQSGARLFYASPYFFASQVCGDCEKYGGSTVQPDFWID